jgi:hypothetical protein
MRRPSAAAKSKSALRPSRARICSSADALDVGQLEAALAAEALQQAIGRPILAAQQGQQQQLGRQHAAAIGREAAQPLR